MPPLLLPEKLPDLSKRVSLMQLSCWDRFDWPKADGVMLYRPDCRNCSDAEQLLLYF